ncbi:hypothetical protein ACN2XU_18190 [Primorskyibacter sp. 2E107]|uniref:hypothetical protein n=1 Tax=Primorskyibacter sp. 2E107 TaxID=3403458 RepID=UPI003AF46680
MSDFELTKTRFCEGVWEGLLTSSVKDAGAPEIAVTLHDKPLHGVMVTEVSGGGRWALEIPVPLEAVGDGVQTFLILDANTDTLLDSFTLIAGEVLGDDIRAEMDLLRAELDMLKRAFRRHCLETM